MAKLIKFNHMGDRYWRLSTGRECWEI